MSRQTLVRTFAAAAIAAACTAALAQNRAQNRLRPANATPAAPVAAAVPQPQDPAAMEPAAVTFDLAEVDAVQFDDGAMLAQAEAPAMPGEMPAAAGEQPVTPDAAAATPAPAANAPAGSMSDVEARMRARLEAARSGRSTGGSATPTPAAPAAAGSSTPAASSGGGSNANANGGFGGGFGRGFGTNGNNATTNNNRGGFGRDTGRTTSGRSGPTSRPAEYAVIVDQNMFVRERRQPRPPEPARRVDPVVPLTPEQSYVLRGVLLEDEGFRAYFENISNNTAVQVGPGDALARGHVLEISIDAVSFERDGQVVWVNVGSNLTGTMVSAPPQRPGYQTAGTTGGGTTGGGTTGGNGQMSAIEAQMRARLEAARNRR